MGSYLTGDDQYVIWGGGGGSPYYMDTMKCTPWCWLALEAESSHLFMSDQISLISDYILLRMLCNAVIMTTGFFTRCPPPIDVCSTVRR